MKRLMAGVAVLGLVLALCAADSRAQSYYHRGGRHSSYGAGRTHRATHGCPSWGCAGPMYRHHSYGYPNYCYTRPTYWDCYPYYTGSYYLPSYPFYYQSGCVSSSFVSSGYYSGSGFGLGVGLGFGR